MRGLSVEVVRKSHSAISQNKFRGQGIHMAISLHNLRDTSLENTPGATLNFTIEISLPDSNFRAHNPKYYHEHDQ